MNKNTLFRGVVRKVAKSLPTKQLYQDRSSEMWGIYGESMGILWHRMAPHDWFIWVKHGELVGGLEHDVYFSIYGEKNYHLTNIFQRV